MPPSPSSLSWIDLKLLLLHRVHCRRLICIPRFWISGIRLWPQNLSVWRWLEIASCLWWSLEDLIKCRYLPSSRLGTIHRWLEIMAICWYQCPRLYLMVLSCFSRLISTWNLLYISGHSRWLAGNQLLISCCRTSWFLSRRLMEQRPLLHCKITARLVIMAEVLYCSVWPGERWQRELILTTTMVEPCSCVVYRISILSQEYWRPDWSISGRSIRYGKMISSRLMPLDKLPNVLAEH